MTRLSAVALGLFLFAASAAAQDATSDEAGEQEILGRINAMRNAAGLGALSRDGRLDAAARTHSADMAWNGFLDHVSPRTGDPSARVHAAGLAPQLLAENVAMASDPIDAHRRLVASDAHRENMMNPSFTHIGLAVVPSDRGVYVTEVFAQLEAAEPEEEEAAPAPELAPGPPEPAPEAEVAPWNGADEVAPEAPPAPAPGGAVVEAPIPEGAPTVQAPAQGERRVTGYWVFAQGRWWYYPLPPGAQPGQVLTPDPSVTGPPPPGLTQQPSYRVYQSPQQPGYRVYTAPRAYYGPTYRIYGGPPPPFGWSPRRHYWRWRHGR